MAKTCIRVEACNIGSSERHNLRSKELDYIRPELTHRNEQWVECSIAEVHRDITEKYKEATGQGLQKKATPIREGVIVISEETTIQQLQDLAEKLEERFGVHAFQIYTHKDEGANVWDGKEEAWKPNYHAHMIFDWTDGHTGKTVKLNRHDMAEMQTITAECLNMERGVSSDKKHLSAMQYKNKMETEKAEQLQKDIEQLNRAYTAGTEKITTVYSAGDYSCHAHNGHFRFLQRLFHIFQHKLQKAFLAGAFHADMHRLEMSVHCDIHTATVHILFFHPPKI